MTDRTAWIVVELNGLIDSLDEHVTHEDIAQALSELRDQIASAPSQDPTAEPDARNPLNRLADDMEHLRRMFAGEYGNIVTPEFREHRARMLHILESWAQPDPSVPELMQPTGFTADAWTVQVFRHLATVYPLTATLSGSAKLDEDSEIAAARAFLDAYHKRSGIWDELGEDDEDGLTPRENTRRGIRAAIDVLATRAARDVPGLS